jgi:hypothetical protein
MEPEVGVIICSDCYKPVMQSSLAEHSGTSTYASSLLFLMPSTHSQLLQDT